MENGTVFVCKGEKIYFFVYDGSSYTSLADCCEKLGVNKASVVSRKYRLGCSYDEAIDYFLNNKNTEV